MMLIVLAGYVDHWRLCSIHHYFY